MILTIISTVMFVIVTVFFIISTNKDKDELADIGLMLSAVFGGTLIVFLALIVLSHIAVDKQIHDCGIRYESLLAQVEAVNSDYEDVSKTTVIQNVANWNANVYSQKYWSENPWTSWFYSKKLADSLNYIEWEGK